MSNTQKKKTVKERGGEGGKARREHWEKKNDRKRRNVHFAPPCLQTRGVWLSQFHLTAAWINRQRPKLRQLRGLQDNISLFISLSFFLWRARERHAVEVACNQTVLLKKKNKEEELYRLFFWTARQQPGLEFSFLLFSCSCEISDYWICEYWKAPMSIIVAITFPPSRAWHR